MFKVSLILLALVAVCACQAPGEGPAPEGKAEPFTMNYQTDSSSRSENSDENGRVTGFYTISDADGRSRRVDYVADEAGFRAKVQTNEAGTSAENIPPQNPADVEVQASPPNPEQYTSYQTSSTGGNFVQQGPPSVTTVTSNVAAQRPVQSSTFQRQVSYNYGANQPGYSGSYGYYSQPAGYNTAYNTGAYGAYNGYGSGYGNGYGNGYYGSGYGSGYGNGYYGSGYGNGYYSSGPSYGVQRTTTTRTTTSGAPNVAYTTGGIRGVQTASGSSGGVTRYSSSGPISGSSYTQTYTVPGSYYQSGPIPVKKA